MMQICELFKSIQGESSRAGMVCSFVRLAGCNLRCLYCDTAYAWDNGFEKSINSIFSEVKTHNTTLVEITGGEPLLQKETPLLLQRFIDTGYTVLIETNGTVDLSLAPPPVIRIVDIKGPSSGHEGSFLEKNYQLLMPGDECKFVISNREDFDWSLDVVRKRKLDSVTQVIFSPNMTALAPKRLAEWIVQENAPVRLGIQLHKIIWGDKRGV
jgi:7-carboxy-7-deazaguanine synthase